MIKLSNVPVYKCDHCTKVSLSAGGIKRHEVFCKKNPLNQTPCASCQNCIRSGYYITDYDGEDIHYSWQEIEEKIKDYSDYGRFEYHKVTEFTCSIDGKKMYHNKVNAMSQVRKDEIIGRCDKQMPQECKYYEYDNF